MKKSIGFLLLLLSFMLYSCENEETFLELSTTAFSAVNYSGETLNVVVNTNSNEQWTATSDADWCTVSPTEGISGHTLQITVKENPKQEERAAIISVTLDDLVKNITIKQQAGIINFDTYHYDLPVIFHVLYKDNTDELQYVSQKRIAEILATVNKLYENCGTDLNLSFSLATTDSQGNKLATPGVEYIQWPESYPISYATFMSDKEKGYVKYLWDPNQYINVMLYKFDDSESDVLGISNMPYTTSGSTYLQGLPTISQTDLILENFKYPHCVSINSTYINDQSTDYYYYLTDVTVTLAHELGHYLGLHHVFSETDEGDLLNSCKDTDYCADTPSYNKNVYVANLQYITLYEPEKFTLENLSKRTNCDELEFISHNMMDYAVSYSDQFTNDQRNRIRHVLNYSPAIPGPKNRSASSRSVQSGYLDLPIRLIK